MLRNRQLHGAAPILRLITVVVTAVVLGCSSLRLDVPRVPSWAIDRPEDTLLGKAFAPQHSATPGESGLRLLVSGEEAFLARAVLAQTAQHTLDLQYYSVSRDATATLLLYGAMRAAHRGVRVRLLIDDLAAAGRDADLAALTAHPNVQIRVFNPFLRRGPFAITRLLEFMADGARLNRRMHNKLWIADNAAAVIGGRNLGDAYFNAHDENDFADLDVLAAGPVVGQASRSFDEYWNSESAVPVAAFVGDAPGTTQLELALSRMHSQVERFRDSEYARALRTTDFAHLLSEGRLALVAAPASVLYDPPAKASGANEQAGRIAQAVRPRLEDARAEVILISPYFVPSERGIGVLCTLARRGVRVAVLTNSLASTDAPVVHAGYARHRPRLLECGVELHELKPGTPPSRSRRAGLSSGASLHAKAMVIDRRFIVVGSMNLDPRSRLSNTEVVVLIESVVLGGRLHALFEEATSLDQAFSVELVQASDEQPALAWIGRAHDRPVRYTSDPLAGWWRHIVSGVLGALIAEELL
jgi:cardiolipin synthase C